MESSKRAGRRESLTGRAAQAVKRLKQNTGETIAELLVAVVISTLGLMLLAGMINAASAMIRSGQETEERYAAGENALADRTGAVVGTGSVTIAYNSVSVSIASGVESIPVSYYANDAMDGSPVVAYGKGGAG